MNRPMPTYRLQTLLELRERTKRAAQASFAEAARALRLKRERLAAADRKLEAMVADRQQHRESYARRFASGKMTMTDLSHAHRYIERLTGEEAEQQGVLDAHRSEVREAEIEMDREQAALIEATRNHEALMRHRKRWADGVSRDRRRREENITDEISQGLFQRLKHP